MWKINHETYHCDYLVSKNARKGILFLKILIFSHSVCIRVIKHNALVRHAFILKCKIFSQVIDLQKNKYNKKSMTHMMC